MTPYDAAKASALAILDERLAGTTMVALLRVGERGRKFEIVTNRGSRMSGMRKEDLARQDFADCCRRLEQAANH